MPDKTSLQLEYYYSMFQNEVINEDALKFWAPVSMYALSSKCPMMTYLYKKKYEPDVEDKFSERKILIRTLMGKYKNLTLNELESIVKSYNLKVAPGTFLKLYSYVDYILDQNKSEDKPSVLQVDKTGYFVDHDGTQLINFNNIFSVIGKEVYIYYVKFITGDYDPATILEMVKEKLFILANIAASQHKNVNIKIAPIFITEADVIIPAYWKLTPEFLKENNIDPVDTVKKYMMSILKNHPVSSDIVKYQEATRKLKPKFCKHCIYKSLELC